VPVRAGFAAHGADPAFSFAVAFTLYRADIGARQVWKYQGTTLVADRALEELRTTVQTPSGLRESKILVTGSMNGSIR
jgi:hypothetical protein